MTVEDEKTRVTRIRQAVAGAQSLVRRYVAKDRSLSEELIKERHEEADSA